MEFSSEFVSEMLDADVAFFLHGEGFRFAGFHRRLEAEHFRRVLDRLRGIDQLELLRGAVRVFDQQLAVGLRSG